MWVQRFPFRGLLVQASVVQRVLDSMFNSCNNVIFFLSLDNPSYPEDSERQRRRQDYSSDSDEDQIMRQGMGNRGNRPVVSFFLVPRNQTVMRSRV